MSRESNKGIVLFANGDASGGASQLPNSTTITSVTINIQIAQRAVFTIAMVYGNQTSYVIRAQLTNNNLYGSLSGGSAPPALTGGSTDADMNAVTPIVSVAQNDDTTPGVNVIDHTYSSTTGTTRDVIMAVGALAGLLSIRVTTAGPTPSAAASVKIGLDTY